MTARDRVPCAGAVIRDEHGRLLLVRRGHAPHEGRWSLPSGRCEHGEDSRTAVRREAHEETGLEVEVGALLATVEREDPDRMLVYVIDEYDCRVVGGTLAAGDDAAEVRWVSNDELRTLPTTPRLIEALQGMGVLG